MQFRFMMDYISWQPSLQPNLVNSSFSLLSPSIVISRSTVFPIVLARYNAIFFYLSLKMTSQRTVYPVWHTFLKPPFTSLTFPIRMMKKQSNSSPILYNSAELRIRGLPILSRQTLTILLLRLANGLNIQRDQTVYSKLASFLIFMALGIVLTAFRNLSFASYILCKSAQEAYFFLCGYICVILVPFLEISAISVFNLLSGEAWVLNLIGISLFFCLDCSPSWDSCLPAVFPLSSDGDAKCKMVLYLLDGVCGKFSDRGSKVSLYSQLASSLGCSSI